MRPLRTMATVHLAANALLLGLGYYWLGIGESRAVALAWSGFVALLLAGLGCCAYSATLVYFRDEGNAQTATAWRTAFRNLLPLAAAVLAIALVYWLLAYGTDSGEKPPLRTITFRIASWLTLKLRKPVRPASILRIFTVALWFIRWTVLPVLLLPVASAVAAKGWRGFQAIKPRVREWRYWVAVPILLLCSLWVPLWLIQWVPGVKGFWMQAVSFSLRSAFAYLLWGAAWLALAFITSRGRPVLTQPSTVVSP